MSTVVQRGSIFLASPGQRTAGDYEPAEFACRLLLIRTVESYEVVGIDGTSVAGSSYYGTPN